MTARVEIYMGDSHATAVEYNRNLRILVVEDEFLIRSMVSEILRDASYTVIEAQNADEAFVILSSMLPDLIITDVQMPDSCDGIGLMKKVRGLGAKIPIIVTSAHLVHVADPSNGPTHFLSKPYDFDRLLELIERASNGG